MKKELRRVLDKYLKNKKLTRKTWLFLLTLLLTNVCIASSVAHSTLPAPVTVTGLVKDESGLTLPGVSIKVKGTTFGTVTDAQGKFTISTPEAGSILQISFVGYVSQEIQIGNNNKGLQITLKADNKSLNEVIVVGYGSQRKTTLTGSVSTIKGDDLVETKNENVVNMLTGKVPGLRIQQLSSEPGAFNTKFDIRGYGTTPLIVIDGIPRSADDLSRMDPNEIDNISVMKDASAAIYGVRSANGVILVTTKKGTNQNGKFNINYSINAGWQQFLNLPKGVDALEYMMLKNESQKRDFGQNFYQQTAPAFSAADMAPYQNGTLQSSDWIDAVMKQNVPQVQQNLNINGGSDKVNYFFDLGYLKQDGVFKSGDMNYDRWNFRSNVNVKLTNRLRAEILTSGYADTKNQPHADVWTMFKYAWNQLPTDQIYANNNPAYPHVEPDNANPVTMTTSSYNGYKVNKIKNFQGQASLIYDIPGIQGLSAKAMYNYGYSPNDQTNVNQSFNLYQYDPQNKTYLPTLVSSPSYVYRGYNTNTSTLMQFSLNYAHKFGNHNITGLVLYEEADTQNDNFNAQREFSLGLPYLFAGNSTNQVANMDPNGLYETVNKGIVGRFNYDYKGKYLAEFGFREDGSSKFKPGSQWGFFPEGSIGWRLSEEQFIKNLIPSKILSNFKVRASYGELGDDSSAGLVPFVPGYTYPSGGAILGGNYVNGLASIGVVNPNLTWYTAKTLDIGADVSLWNGLLDGTFDYFVRTRTGLLDTRTSVVPGTAGTALPQENLDSDQTKGFDMIISHRNHIGSVGYNISVNGSISRTMKLVVQQTRAGNSYDNWKNGQADRYTNIWWGKDYGGQFQSYSQIYNYPINTGGGNQAVVPGDYYYKDWNNDGVIDSKDEHPIATRDIPLVNFGMTLGANWKGFDLNMLLQGSTLFHVQYAEQLAQPLLYGRSALTQFLDRWHTAVPGADVYDPNTVWVPGNYPTTGSPPADGTKAVQNATYVRIKSLELGYTLPNRLLKKAGISKLRVYVNSYNLATLTGLKNSDPEHPGVVAQGADWNYSQGGYLYPLNRSFNVGANVTF
jgi:TonB-linked SusC/RagA family outer membrane protein